MKQWSQVLSCEAYEDSIDYVTKKKSNIAKMRNFINLCLLFSSGFLVFGWSPNPPISNSARSLAATSLESSGVPEEKSGNTQTVCIIGGGFGGLTCALSLSSLVKEKKDKPKIVLIDKRERFVFLPLLYELCVGDATIEEVAPTYSYLLEGTGVEFIQADVCDIDKQKQVVYSASGEEEICKYDSIILATGNEASFFGVPGAEKFAQAFYTIEDCYELRKKLSYFDARDSDFEKPLEVVVVGAGYSGVELALNIGERLCKSDDMHVNTYLVHRGNEILPSASDFNRQSSEAELVKKGVQLLTGTSVNEVQSTEAEERKKVLLSKNDGSIETIECDLLLWTTGNKPSDIIKRANFVTDKNGRIVTGKSLAVKGEKNIFAIGKLKYYTCVTSSWE